MHQQQKEIELQSSAPDVYDIANQSRLHELLGQQTKLKHELDKVEASWLEVAESLQPKGTDSVGR